jgi:hypothetical protein
MILVFMNFRDYVSEERAGTFFCLEPSFRLAVIVLPFGAENLYEPKECLLFTQKRYPSGVRLEDIEPQRCKSWISNPQIRPNPSNRVCRKYFSESTAGMPTTSKASRGLLEII